MTAAANPDCTNGRHRECSGQAWDWDIDDLVPCPCDHHRPAPAADLSRGLVLAKLDRNTATALAHAIGRDAAAHYDRVRHDDFDDVAAAVAGPCMWPYQARVVCPEPADPDDPARFCAEHAEIDAGGR